MEDPHDVPVRLPVAAVQRDPLSLSNSDNPGMALTTIPFDGTNFTFWSMQIEMALGAKLKLSFIDGSRPKPLENNVDFERWKMCDRMVICWILNSMTRDLSSAFIYSSSARALWLEICDRYKQSNGPLLYQLQQELSQLSQGNLSVTAYFVKLKKIWDELQSLNGIPICTCGAMVNCQCNISAKMLEMDNQNKLMQFLLRLNEDFEHAKGQILASDPLPSVNKAYSTILQIEKQKQITRGISIDSAAFVAGNSENLNRNSSSSGYNRYGSTDKKDFKKNKGDKRICTYCKGEGHLAENCFERIGYPDWYKGKRGRKVSNTKVAAAVDSDHYGYGDSPVDDTPMDVQKHCLDNQMMNVVNTLSSACQAMMKAFGSDRAAMSATSRGDHRGGQSSFHFSGISTFGPSLSHLSSAEWIIDSGATDHMSFCADMFTNKRVLPCPIFIVLPDGSSQKVDTVGEVILCDGLMLEEVLFVPQFKFHLISISKLIKNKHFGVLFSGSRCVLQDLRSDRYIAVAHETGGLYKLKMTDIHTKPKNSEVVVNHISSDGNNVAELLHKRLGHISSSKMSHLDGLSTQAKGNNILCCDICSISKAHRLPFGTSDSHSKFYFELLHIDLWGPYKVPSLSGASYFLTILDDCSRATWTYLIVTKDQVYHVLQEFFTYVENHFGQRAKFIRSDNGTEFLNANCARLFTHLGIVHQRSMSYSPQQNGRVERKHRHLIETARALRLQAGLPVKFWGECVMTATYLINKMPSAVLQWKSPYEVLFGKKPSLDHLRIFGCLCYVTLPRRNLDKFAPKAARGVFIGYPINQKGYTVFDLETEKVILSRDVVFREHVFPFHKSSSCSPDIGDAGLFVPAHDLDDNNEVMVQMGNGSVPDLVNNDDTSNVVEDLLPQGDALIPLRRTARISTRPVYLGDYVVGSAASDYQASLAHVLATKEPYCFRDAQADPRWVDAMEQELNALEKNGTWELSVLPPGKRAVKSKWVYKVKYKSDGSVERFKARLVVKGFSQKLGKDYKHTFSPVAKLPTVRIFIAIAVSKEWPIYQMDVNNAFLHGHIDEEIYMEPPEGYSKAGIDQVCLLKRSLYGLKQASRQWNLELSTFLISLGYVQSKHDYSLFIRSNSGMFSAILVYVDDILVTGNNVVEIDRVKEALNAKFTIKDLGLARYFLGMELYRDVHGVYLSQRKYILDILQDANFLESRPTDFPLPAGAKLSITEGELIEDPETYRRLIGRLLYLSLTRPNLSYSVQHLSQFVSQPRVPHLDVAHHVLQYLEGSVSKGLFYLVQSSLKVTGFSDADWGACVSTRKSLTGFCVFLGHSLVSWKTKKQPTVSRSSAEAEYRSMAATTAELLWVSYVLKDLEVCPPLPVTLFCDNKAAQHIAANPCFHERTKHLEIDCHFTRDKIVDGFLRTAYIPSNLQLADVLTKALGKSQHQFLCSRLGLQDAQGAQDFSS